LQHSKINVAFEGTPPPQNTHLRRWLIPTCTARSLFVKIRKNQSQQVTPTPLCFPTLQLLHFKQSLKTCNVLIVKTKILETASFEKSEIWLYTSKVSPSQPFIWDDILKQRRVRCERVIFLCEVSEIGAFMVQ